MANHFTSMRAPANLEAKWDTIFEDKGLKTPMDISEYENENEQMLVRAETKMGYKRREMRLLRAISEGCQKLTWVTFHDWKCETNNQALLYDGLHSDLRTKMPVSVSNDNEMKTWIDEIVFKIGGRSPVTNYAQL